MFAAMVETRRIKYYSETQTNALRECRSCAAVSAHMKGADLSTEACPTRL